MSGKTTIFYDNRDVRHARKLDDRRFQWIEELGGGPLQDAPVDAAGFLFGYQGHAEDYRKLVHDRPNISDRPEEREELRHLDCVLERLDNAGVGVPRPQSWVLRIDDHVPADIAYPVFVRTSVSSWKRGGHSPAAMPGAWADLYPAEHWVRPSLQAAYRHPIIAERPVL